VSFLVRQIGHTICSTAVASVRQPSLSSVSPPMRMFVLCPSLGMTVVRHVDPLLQSWVHEFGTRAEAALQFLLQVAMVMRQAALQRTPQQHHPLPLLPAENWESRRWEFQLPGRQVPVVPLNRTHQQHRSPRSKMPQEQPLHISGTPAQVQESCSPSSQHPQHGPVLGGCLPAQPRRHAQLCHHR